MQNYCMHLSTYKKSSFFFYLSKYSPYKTIKNLTYFVAAAHHIRRQGNSMEALWNLEDKWKISTQQAFLLLVSAAFAVIGLCMAATVLLKKAQRKQEQQLVMSSQREAVVGQPKWSEPSCGWGSITRALVSSVRWSRRSKWEERRGGSWRETPLPLLDKRVEVEVGWRSHNSDSPVWQRPILMGEKCELPRFSGLILYDERGRPLCDSDSHKEIRNQENTGGVGRTTLRDLL